MVREVISSVKPNVVMVELCEARRNKVLAMSRGQGETVLDLLLRVGGVSKETAGGNSGKSISY